MENIKNYVDFSYKSIGISVAVFVIVTISMYYGLLYKKDELEIEENWKVPLYSSLTGLFLGILSLFLYKIVLKQKNNGEILTEPYPSKLNIL